MKTHPHAPAENITPLPRDRRAVVAIGASAGGVEALRTLVSMLPATFPAAVIVVVHFPGHLRSSLPEILSRAGPLPATHAIHGEPMNGGHIYVAPPDNHLTVADGHLRVLRGPKDNGHRPSVDAMFRTAAKSLKTRLVGVVLSGTLDCGAAGLSFIKACGGATVVQSDALFADMPKHARDAADPAYCLPLREIPGLLENLLRETVKLETGPVEDGLMKMDFPLTCPECHGGLVETLDPGGHPSFKCRVGHLFSADTMMLEQIESTENALWAAVRSLEESAQLADRMGAHADRLLRPRFEEKAAALRLHAELLQRVLFKGLGPSIER